MPQREFRYTLPTQQCSTVSSPCLRRRDEVPCPWRPRLWPLPSLLCSRSRSSPRVSGWISHTCLQPSKQGFNSRCSGQDPERTMGMKFWGHSLGCQEDLFSVLLAASMERACMVQPAPLLFVCLSGCLFVISPPKGDSVNYRSTEHREVSTLSPISKKGLKRETKVDYI